MRLSSGVRIQLFWLVAVLWILSLFLAFAGWGKLPPTLENTTHQQMVPHGVSQVQAWYKRTRKISDPYSYILWGTSVDGRPMQFSLSAQPEKLSMLRQITTDPGARTTLDLWVERNELADILQVRQGDRMVLSYADAVEQRQHDAWSRFYQALGTFGAGGAVLVLALATRGARPTQETNDNLPLAGMED